MHTGFEDVDRQNGAAMDHMTCSYKHKFSTLTLPQILFHLVRFSYFLLSIYSRKMALTTIGQKCQVNYFSHLIFAKVHDSRSEDITRALCIALWLKESFRIISNAS